MASSSIKKFKDINPTDMKIRSTKPNENGCTAFIKLPIPGKFGYVQLPYVRSFGASSYQDSGKYSLTLVMDQKDQEENQSDADVVQWAKDIEQQAKVLLKENSQEFFGCDDISDEDLDESFNPWIRESPKHEGMFTLKLPFIQDKNGKQITELFDKKGKAFSKRSNIRDNIPSQSMCKAIITPASLYCIKGKSGICWKLRSVMVDSSKREEKKEELAFLSDSDDE